MLSMRSSSRLGLDDKEFSRKWSVRRSCAEEEQWTTRSRERHERSSASSSDPAEGELLGRAAHKHIHTNCTALSNKMSLTIFKHAYLCWACCPGCWPVETCPNYNQCPQTWRPTLVHQHSSVAHSDISGGKAALSCLTDKYTWMC